jgi:mannose-6-phosphate isomerase-like protein (cupin superfamily)
MAMAQIEGRVQRFGHLVVGTANLDEIAEMQAQVRDLGASRTLILDLGGPETRGAVAVIGTQGDAADGETARWRQFPAQHWSDKYQCDIASLEPEATAGADRRQASVYAVRLPGAAATAPLHVHHHLSNLVLVAAEPGTEPGMVAFEEGGRCMALRLVAGDAVLVRPGVLHNLIATSRPFSFIVINDVESHYENEDDSDYHNTTDIDLGDVIMLPRERETPQLIMVG